MAIDAARFGSKQHSAVRADERVRCLSPRRGTSVSRPGLRHVGLAQHGGRPTVRPWAEGDLCCSEPRRCRRGLAFREHRPDLRPPCIVPVVTPDVGQPNVFRDEVPAGRLKNRTVVGPRRPLGARRGDRIERAAPLVVVALRHLAPQGDELAALGHLHDDTPHRADGAGPRPSYPRRRHQLLSSPSGHPSSCWTHHKERSGPGRLHRLLGTVGCRCPGCHAGSAT
jgi:hypothetical protein